MKCAFFLLLTIFVVPFIFAEDARILNGHDVDTLRRFPHYVTIRTHRGAASYTDLIARYCSGSIISDKWILTSMHCLEGGDQFDILFRRKSNFSGEDSFQISVHENAVHRYPTGYDDLALIKLPVYLSFDEKIRPVHIAFDTKLEQKLVVMPGFKNYGGYYESQSNNAVYYYPDSEGSLQYGMFGVVPKHICQKEYGSDFDEYLHICVMGWKNNNQTPCEENIGGGLIIGWPTKPELVGVFSQVSNCEEGKPSIFVNTSKYRDWISSVIGKDIDIVGWTVGW